MQSDKRTMNLTLAVLLMTILILSAALYRSASRPLVRPEDAPLVQKARRDSLKIFPRGGADRGSNFAIVMRLEDRSCVELRSRATDKAGTYLACYDAHTGKIIEERAHAGF